MSYKRPIVLRAALCYIKNNEQGSDYGYIDVLVRFSCPKSIIEIIGLERIISDRIGKKVELITEQSLNRHVAPYILQDLQPAYGKR